MFEILETLCAIPAPVGREHAIHTFLLERWAPHARSAKITTVGNLVAHIGGEGPTLMLVGHGDEIGFTIKHISEDGFLYFTSGQRAMGDGPEMRGFYTVPNGQPALIVTRHGTVEGVFATLTGHVLTQRQRETIQLDYNDMWVDVCASSRAEVQELGINVGDRVVWNPPTRRRGKYIYGKAMDNRSALAVMDVLLERLDPAKLAYNLYYVSTIQEEFGCIGAHSVNREIGAQYAIALDIGLSGDVPGVDQRNVSTRLGAGPILIHKDNSAYDARLNDAIIDAATDAGLPLQQAVFNSFGTDAGPLIREGVAASAIGIPTRYTHSPNEMLHEDDLTTTVALLQAFLEHRPAVGG